jgi:hypothetical protein
MRFIKKINDDKSFTDLNISSYLWPISDEYPLSDQLESFKKWPQQMSRNAHKLAAYGYIYTEIGDESSVYIAERCLQIGLLMRQHSLNIRLLTQIV